MQNILLQPTVAKPKVVVVVKHLTLCLIYVKIEPQ